MLDPCYIFQGLDNKTSIPKSFTSKMLQMQMELQPSWPNRNDINPIFNPTGMDVHVGSFEFSSASVSQEDFSDVSSLLLSPTMCANETYSFPFFGNNMLTILPVESFFPTLDAADSAFNEQFIGDCVENLSEWKELDDSLSSSKIFPEDVSCLSSSPTAVEVPMDAIVLQPSLFEPSEDMQVDEQLGIFHLLKAYEEAVEHQQKFLAEEIIRRLRVKACPTGKTFQRIAYYMTLASDKQGDYLRQESTKNDEMALKVFYQITPYGRFAHFTANSAIIEAIPEPVATIHIIDFKISKGLQWPPLIEALGRRGRRMLRLTSIKWEEDDDSRCHPSSRNFEETKKQLYAHARSVGLRLKVEEMDVESLVSELKKGKKRGGSSEFLVFNCMVGLPHVGRESSVGHVQTFLQIAKESINNQNMISNGINDRGILVLGSQSISGEWINCEGFGTYFDRKLSQFQGIFESMEEHFPADLAEARITMECLFLAPYIPCLASYLNQEEATGEFNNFLAESGLKAWKMSQESYVEAKELVREGESSYWVGIEGENQNQMVLGYRGTALMRVSCWR